MDLRAARISRFDLRLVSDGGAGGPCQHGQLVAHRRWIFFEAYHRFFDTPELESLGLLFGVGSAGLGHQYRRRLGPPPGSGESLNVEGAFQHVLGDLLGSVGVIIAAILILTLEWYIVDPIISVLIGLLILRSSWGLFMRVFKVLLEGTPDT